MKATFTDHLPSGKTVEYTSVPLPVWNTQGNPIASNQYVVDGTEIKRTGLHSDEGKLQDFIVNLMNVHFGGMVLDVPSECPIKKLYTSSDLKFLLDWYAGQLTKNSDEINALFIRVQELERKSFSSSDGYYYITPKDTSMISFVTGTNLVLSTIKNKFDVGGSGDELVFTSKNPELFTVENGNLVKKGTGIGVLEAGSKKNSSLKTTVKVLSIRPEDVSLLGVASGTTAPMVVNLDTNTGDNITPSTFNVTAHASHNGDVDEIKRNLTLTETYNVDNTGSTYRLNAQGKPETTGVVGTGTLTKTVTVSYGTEQVKSETVSTSVRVERTQRTLELKKPVVFIEQASLEYVVSDVLDVKYNGTSESLSGYTVKYGSPFRIEGNKLKYTGTFGDAATLTLVKDGTEVSTSVNTYRLPTFSTVDDNVTTSAHSRKKITVPNPTGPVMSLPGIVTETAFVQSTSDIYVEATGNTADVFGMSAITGTLTITQTVYYNTTLLTQHVQTVNVTVTSNEVQDTRRLVLKGAALQNPMVVFNDQYEEMTEDEGFFGYNDHTPISELVSIEGGTGTIKIKENALNAKITDGNLFDIPDDLTEDKLAPVEFYIDGTDISKTVNVQYYAHPQPTVSIPTTNQFAIGDNPMQFNINFDGEACVSDSRFRKEVEWSVEGGIGTISDSGLFTPTTAGTGTIIAHVKCTFDGVKILDLEIRGRLITVKDKYELIYGHSTFDLNSDGLFVIYNNVKTSQVIYGIKSTKNGQPVMPQIKLGVNGHTYLPDSDGTIHSDYLDVSCTKNSGNTYDVVITPTGGLHPGETARGYLYFENADFNYTFILQEFITDIYAVPTQVQMNKAQRIAYFDVFVNGVPSKYGYSYCQTDYDITYNDQNGNWSVTGSTDDEMMRSGYNRITVEQHNDVQNTGIDIVVRSRHDSSKTITVPVRYTAGQSTSSESSTTPTPTPTTPPVSDDVTYVDSGDADEQFEIGDHVKLKAREYPNATYTWHLPDGSTREGRELNFVATTDNAGMYVAYTFQPGSNKVIRTNYNVSFFSIQETAVSGADKEIHVGDSIDFTAPPAVGMLYSSDGGAQVDDEYLTYQWQITTTPDVDSSWTSIAGATEHNLKYVASEAGVYYIRRTVTMGDGEAYGGKTKVTVLGTVQTTPKRIANVTVNGINLVKIQAGTPATVNYTVTYNGELEDGNTNNFNIVPSNAESSYTIGDNNSVTIDGIDITVDKTNKTIAFHTESNLGAKEVELEVLSNSNVVGMFTVNVAATETTSTPTSPVLEEHGVRVNPNDNSASTSTPTPTPKPVDDNINKSTPRPVRDGNTPSPKPVDDGSTPTPTPTAGPVL